MEEEMDTNRAFEAEMPRLRRYALKLTRDDGAADELVQECLVRGLSNLNLWREGSNLPAFPCANRIRRAKPSKCTGRWPPTTVQPGSLDVTRPVLGKIRLQGQL